MGWINWEDTTQKQRVLLELLLEIIQKHACLPALEFLRRSDGIMLVSINSITAQFKLTALKMQASTPCKSSRAAVMTRRKAVHACEILLSSHVSESHMGTCRSMPHKDWELGTKNSTEAGVLARDASHAPAGAFGPTRPSNTYRSLSVG